MNPYTISLACCAGLFLAIFLSGRLGHWAGRRRRQQQTQDVSTGTIDAAVLSLMGLLIAFTFSSAFSRYELRRQLIVDEVNAIGTAALRLDLLPAETQPPLRSAFRKYARSRWDMWQLFPEREAALAEYARTQALQNEIWSLAVAATQNETQGDARKLLLPALNEMIDITTTRLVTVQAHTPLVIFGLLGMFSLVAGWITGFGMAGSERPSDWHLLGFAAAVSVSLFVILDIEFPRYGLVNLHATHQLFLELEKSLK